jgi:FkbM family methyltransferase
MPDISKADKPLIDICSEVVQPGTVVWDIGANVGLFSFCAAGKTGPAGIVYSVEPDTDLVTLLRHSSRSNPQAAPVEVLPFAVAERMAIQSFNIAARSRSANYLEGSFGSTQTGGVQETQRVISVTLDWLLTEIKPPSVVKIDAEGSEARVLQGGKRLLREHRPIVICEVADETSEEVTELLSEAQYELYDYTEPKLKRSRKSKAPWDTLAIPQ